MAKKKTLKVLLAILLSLCAATFAISRYENRKEEIRTSGEEFFSIDTQIVSTLSWNNGSDSVTLQKQDDVWTWSEDETFPVDNGEVGTLLNHFSSYRAAFVIENADDLSLYGLDDPVLRVSMITEDDTAYQISFGDYSTMDEQRYVSINDGNVYLVEDDLTEVFNISQEDLFLDDTLPSIKIASQISISGETDATIVYLEENEYSICEDDVYFLKQGENYLPLSTSLVKSYLSNSITYLNLGDHVTYNASTSDLSVYGLDVPDNVIIVDYTDANMDEQQLKIEVAIDPTDKEKADEENYDYKSYVRINDSEIIYEISESTAKSLQDLTYDAFRHKELFIGNSEEVYQIDIELEDSIYSLIYDSDQKKWLFEEREIVTDDLQNAIEDLAVSDFGQEKPEGRREIAFTLYLNNDLYPEYTISIYRYDSNQCFVVLNGEAFGYISRSEIVDLIETVNQLILG